jgi:hypothetical protein
MQQFDEDFIQEITILVKIQLHFYQYILNKQLL